VQFNGLFVSDRAGPGNNFIQIYTGDTLRSRPSGETVGSGEISDDMENILPFSTQFDKWECIAIGPSAKLEIWGDERFSGTKLLDRAGPVIIYNTIRNVPGQIGDDIRTVKSRSWDGNQPTCLRGCSGARLAWQDIFPPSKRIWSTSNMREWPGGSLKITCSASGSSLSVPAIQSLLKLIEIDPLLNVATTKTAAKIDLPKGRYAATIKSMDTRVSGKYGATIRIQYTSNGSKKTAQFLDKGRFDSSTDAKNAHEGLSLAFDHDGGDISVYFPIMPTPDVSGTSVISIEPTGFIVDKKSVSIPDTKIQKVDVKKPKKRWVPPKVEIVNADQPSVFACPMSISHLAWYKKGWDEGKCCGLVVNVSGQDYIVFKRSIGDDDACGGGESLDTPCIAASQDITNQHPAFAWPTFDKKTFAPIPSDDVRFHYDKNINDAVQQKIEKSEYNNPQGSPAGYRHLAYQLSIILFPVS